MHRRAFLSGLFGAVAAVVTVRQAAAEPLQERALDAASLPALPETEALATVEIDYARRRRRRRGWWRFRRYGWRRRWRVRSRWRRSRYAARARTTASASQPKLRFD